SLPPVNAYPHTAHNRAKTLTPSSALGTLSPGDSSPTPQPPTRPPPHHGGAPAQRRGVVGREGHGRGGGGVQTGGHTLAPLLSRASSRVSLVGDPAAPCVAATGALAGGGHNGGGLGGGGTPRRPLS